MHATLVPIKPVQACREDLVHGSAAGAQRSHRHRTRKRDQTLHGSGGSEDVAGFHDGVLERLDA
jgi:hypothetical protein